MGILFDLSVRTAIDAIPPIKILFPSISPAEARRHVRILFNSRVSCNTGYSDKDIRVGNRADRPRAVYRWPISSLPARVFVYLHAIVYGMRLRNPCSKDTCIGHGRASSPRCPLLRSFA